MRGVDFWTCKPVWIFVEKMNLSWLFLSRCLSLLPLDQN
jgi:hypothetical protein